MVIVAGDEDVSIGDRLPSHDLSFPPVLKFGGWVAGCSGFVAVCERGGDAGDVEDEVVAGGFGGGFWSGSDEKGSRC